MGTIRNALPEVMGRHRIKQARLAEAAGIRYATLNALYNGRSKGVDFDTLAAVLDGLNTLTGKTYSVADLLAYERGHTEPGDAEETAAVLADHPDILERIARLERGEERLISIEEVAAKYGVKLR